jgi:hypothetical protein
MGLIRRIAQIKPAQRQRPFSTRGGAGECFEASNNDLTLESIRDLITEAYGCVDKKRRSNLLENQLDSKNNWCQPTAPKVWKALLKILSNP